MFLREPSHWLIVVLALVLLFGWKRLPDMARSVGRSMRIFKSEVNEMKNDGKEGRPHSAHLSRRPRAVALVSAEPHPHGPLPVPPQP